MTARPAGKKPSLPEVLQVLEKLHGPPLHAERPEDPLLDHLLVGVLALHAGLEKARDAVRHLSATYLDFNELRVSGKTEIQQALEAFVPAERLPQAAWDLRMALQDVYDGTHGLDLEPLRGRDPDDLKHFLTRLPNTAGGPAAMVIQLAVGEKSLVLGPLESQLLDRLGLLPRAATPARVRQAVEKLIKPGERARFAWLTGASARLMLDDCDPQHPFGQLLIDSRAKELAEREKRRKEEEVRRKAEEKRLALEAAKQARLDAIAARKREAEEARKAVQEAARRKKEEAAQKAAAQKAAEAAARKAALLEAQKKKAAEAAAKKLAAQKAAELAKKEAVQKKAAALKAAELAKKEAAAKKAAAQKAAQKAADEAKKAAAKKAAARKKK